MRRIVWFSCGAASAVAAKLAVDKYGAGCEVVYCDTFATEHEDNIRFFADVSAWLGRSITIIRSDKYATVDDVIEKRRYMSGVKGAPCTTEMKKFPREAYQRPGDIHIFGYTAGEEKRAERFEEANQSLYVEWILIEQGVSKADCLARVSAAGIALPWMYLHFDHNNCKGCVKATSPGYWNKTRRLFPDVFARRVRQSRLLGVKLVRVAGERVYLDQLLPDEYAPDDNIDCGPICQISTGEARARGTAERRAEMTNKPLPEIPEAEYAEATEALTGWCRTCQAFTRELTEPDARKYQCPVCRLWEVFGAEEALVMELFTFTDDDPVAQEAHRADVKDHYRK